MENTQMTRRSFLLLSAGAAVVTVFPGCTHEIGLNEEERQAFLRVARLLYPHDTLSDEIYKEVLNPLSALQTSGITPTSSAEAATTWG